MMRDRLVCGINNDCIQRQLSAEKDLTFVKALDITMAMELAEKVLLIFRTVPARVPGVCLV